MKHLQSIGEVWNAKSVTQANLRYNFGCVRNGQHC